MLYTKDALSEAIEIAYQSGREYQSERDTSAMEARAAREKERDVADIHGEDLKGWSKQDCRIEGINDIYQGLPFEDDACSTSNQREVNRLTDNVEGVDNFDNETELFADVLRSLEGASNDLPAYRKKELLLEVLALLEKDMY